MEKKEEFNNILRALKLKAVCSNYFKIKNMSLYDIELLQGGRVKDLTKFLEEISLMLKLKKKPTVKVINELGIIRFEAVNEKPDTIDFFSEREINTAHSMPMYLGNTVENEKLTFDMTQNPHLLVAGTTGSGKSTILHSIIANALIDNNSNIYLIDTKNIEFSPYKGVYKNIEVGTTYQEGLDLLLYLNTVMEYRYKLIKEQSLSSRHFDQKKPIEKHIIFIIDEFADLIMQDENKKLYNSLCTLSQKCRAAGIYCILATQRPSVNVISGTIKANFPARIACKVASGIDSRVILDKSGAENLLGRGDAIIKNYNNDYTRFQATFITQEQILSNIK